MSPPSITSLTNEKVKAAVRLRERRHRDRTGLTIVDGARELRRAIAAGVVVETVFISDSATLGPDAARVADDLRGTRSTVAVSVSPAVLAKIAFGDRDDGVVGIVRTPSVALDALIVGADPLIIVTDSVEKPGNLGAILRTADGVGADAIVVADPRTDPWNPNVIRASLGTIFDVSLAVSDPGTVIAWLRSRAVRLITAEVDAAQSHTDADLTGPIAIVVGSEADGLGPLWLAEERSPVRIPMHGRADSLNVSVATAIIAYEARRQRDVRARHNP